MYKVIIPRTIVKTKVTLRLKVGSAKKKLTFGIPNNSVVTHVAKIHANGFNYIGIKIKDNVGIHIIWNTGVSPIVRNRIQWKHHCHKVQRHIEDTLEEYKLDIPDYMAQKDMISILKMFVPDNDFDNRILLPWTQDKHGMYTSYLVPKPKTKN